MKNNCPDAIIGDLNGLSPPKVKRDKKLNRENWSLNSYICIIKGEERDR